MRLVLADILALAASGAYAINAALSDESAALILSAAVDLADPDNWEGAGYFLTDDETDTIDDMVAAMINEVMIPGWEEGNGEDMSYAVIADQKTTGVNGGTFTSGAWRVRDLNTELCDPDEIVSVADNKFTLPAGTYFVLASAPGYRVNWHKLRLWNATDEEVMGIGTSESSNVAAASVTRSFVAAAFTLTEETDIELEHRCSTTYANTGFGVAVSFAAEIYSLVIIVKAD